MSFEIEPEPEMMSQRLLPSFLHFRPLTAVIDPTCGRYCLKALLKYWIQRVRGESVSDENLVLPRPSKPNGSWLKPGDWFDVSKWDPHWIGYHPYVDFENAKKYLIRWVKPASLEDWAYVLEEYGPVILSGVLGAASVEHYILLTGVDTDKQTFLFKDPLTGDAKQEEEFDIMNGNIDHEIIHAHPVRMKNNLPGIVDGQVRL